MLGRRIETDRPGGAETRWAADEGLGELIALIDTGRRFPASAWPGTAKVISRVCSASGTACGFTDYLAARWLKQTKRMLVDDRRLIRDSLLSGILALPLNSTVVLNGGPACHPVVIERARRRLPRSAPRKPGGDAIAHDKISFVATQPGESVVECPQQQRVGAG